MKQFKYKYDSCPDILINEYETINSNIVVFRLVKNSNCKKSDFLPHCKVVKWWNKECIENVLDPMKCCMGCGLSVFLDKEDAIKNYKRRPKLGRYIFMMIFDKDFGKLYKTKTKVFPSHATFFIYEDVDECEIFSLKEEIR
jgi:hypothetical protein